MEDNERFWGDGFGFGYGQFGSAPNGMGYGFTYPGLAPFWGFGLEPNLWGDAKMGQGDYDNSIMRNHMMHEHMNHPNMAHQMKPIDMLYPKCYKMMFECVYKECNMFIKKNNNIMPNRISKEEFCKMVENCSMQLMNNEEMFIDKLKQPWLCNRDVDVEENEIETRGNLGRYGNLLVSSMMGILLLQELRRRGCLYCY